MLYWRYRWQEVIYANWVEPTFRLPHGEAGVSVFVSSQRSLSYEWRVCAIYRARYHRSIERIERFGGKPNGKT